MGASRVALVRGDDRYQNVRQTLELIADQIDLADKQRIVIKPNFVSATNKSAATHVDAVRAVVEFLWDHGVQKATFAEGCAVGDVRQGIRRLGYTDLIKRFGLEVVDLNTDKGVSVSLYDRSLGPLTLEVARTAVESDLRISVGPPKTHDFVQVTLSLKNYAVGSLLKRYKSDVHQGYAGINLNLYKLAHVVAPDLSVIDGTQGMEGRGPVGGQIVDWGIAIASTDFLAADALAAQAMGFQVENIGYLHYCAIKELGCARVAEMEIVGNTTFEAVLRRFASHPDTARMLEWQVPNVAQYL